MQKEYVKEYIKGNVISFLINKQTKIHSHGIE